MDTTLVRRWASHRRAVAGEPVQASVLSGCGALEQPWRLAISGQRGAAPQPVPPGEIGLWWAAVDAGVDVDALISQPTEGSLLRRDQCRAIEAWTAADPCELHAQWRIARQRRRDDLRRRCEQARNWHLERTQPDNASNRPWALHVFLLAGDEDGRMYAETLRHNSMAVTGRPEPTSAAILRDAAAELECAIH